MSDLEKFSDYGDIDEAEEEALLRSDEDQPMDNSEDSSSDDDCDEINESKLTKEFLQILGQIEENKYNYENYTKLIDVAHQLSDLQKIRESYQLFSSVYPLAPEIWLRWLKIEQNLASSATELEKVEQLFRRALSDYYSVDVALEFAQLSFKLPIDKADLLWDELLSVYALHCMKGRQFFILWRKYNEKHENPDNAIITDIFKKEISLPLYNMEESYIEFKVFNERNKDTIDINWTDIDKKYNKAKNYLQKILPYEKKLQELDSKAHQERANIYKEYIQEADNFIDEPILQVIYERMVTECCLNPECWLSYVKYLEQRDNDDDEMQDVKKYNPFKQSILDVINRALRNCTWSEKLYLKKMYIAEDMSYTKTEIREIFENALEAGFQTPEPMVTLWLEYLTFLKRHTNFEDEKEKGILRANFDLAWNSLGRQWGVLADCDCQILQFWGRLEYDYLGDLNKGKELWVTVMESAENSSSSGLWIEFAHLEIKRGIEVARKVFRKALNEKSIDNPRVIVSAWLRFERCYGSVDDLILCQEECDKFLSQYNWQQNKKNNMNQSEAKSKFLKRKFPVKDNEISDANFKSEFKFKKPKLNDEKPLVKKASKTQLNIEQKPSEMVSTPMNEHENQEIDFEKDHLRIFLSNLDYNITEEELRLELPELDIAHVDLIKSANGKGRGFGYVELKSDEAVKDALKLDKKLVKGRPLYISSVLRDKEKRQKFKYSDEIEPTKLFVKGVPYDSTKEELEELFKPFGKIKDIRIVCHKSGKPKGIAYVEYEEESSASIAVLKLDQHELRGFKLNVAISAPPPKPKAKDEKNLHKLLGMGFGRTQKASTKDNQKMRMNLIPSVVRRNVESKNKINTTNNSSGIQPPQPPKEKQQQHQQKKTNEDFRKLLYK